MTASKNWYAVYTRPHWEKKISSLLSKKEIENYCPVNRVIRQWKDRKKMIFEPLFTSYVFVHLAENDMWRVRATEGVLNLVHWLNKPAIIREEEIEAIKNFLSDYESVRLEKTRVNPNDHVRIIDGPLMSMQGNVLEVSKKSVRVLLPSLGYQMVAELDIDNVEKIVGLTSDASNLKFQRVS